MKDLSYEKVFKIIKNKELKVKEQVRILYEFFTKKKE